MDKWIFFDIDSTLVDEQAAYDHRIRDMIADTDLTFEEVHAKRVELALQGLDGNSAIIKFFGLAKTPWHSETLAEPIQRFADVLESEICQAAERNF